MRFMVDGTIDQNLWGDAYLARIVEQAETSLAVPIGHITDHVALLSAGGPHDFYSNGDYWWPNPDTTTGLPYVRQDGQSNPAAFLEHRRILRQMRSHVANLTAGYLVTDNACFAHRAISWLQEFFLDEGTKMNPHLLYGQAVPGRCSGRSIGIIDTLHLIDVPVAIEKLKLAGIMCTETYQELQQWFTHYLAWMTTHPYGIEEMNAKNNHGVCWHVQASLLAKFTQNQQVTDRCIDRFKTRLLPDQMALDGSFPAEIKRTKPYGYSIFQLDNMINLCHILSTPEESLWEFQLADGRSIQRGLDYLYPYLVDKQTWPYQPDIQSHQYWPVALAGLLFAGVALQQQDYVRLWRELEKDPADEEVRRNMAIRQPILWLQ